MKKNQFPVLLPINDAGIREPLLPYLSNRLALGLGNVTKGECHAPSMLHSGNLLRGLIPDEVRNFPLILSVLPEVSTDVLRALVSSPIHMTPGYIEDIATWDVFLELNCPTHRFITPLVSSGTAIPRAKLTGGIIFVLVSKHHVGIKICQLDKKWFKTLAKEQSSLKEGAESNNQLFAEADESEGQNPPMLIQTSMIFSA